MRLPLEQHRAPAELIRKTFEARREDRGREAMEYANCVNNVYTGAGCDVIGKFCDTPGLRQQGAMIRVEIILKFSFLHSVL
jgi:hypothetical protein